MSNPATIHERVDAVEQRLVEFFSKHHPEFLTDAEKDAHDVADTAEVVDTDVKDAEKTVKDVEVP